jgi:hypothetical protein
VRCSWTSLIIFALGSAVRGRIASDRSVKAFFFTHLPAAWIPQWTRPRQKSANAISANFITWQLYLSLVFHCTSVAQIKPQSRLSRSEHIFRSVLAARGRDSERALGQRRRNLPAGDNTRLGRFRLYLRNLRSGCGFQPRWQACRSPFKTKLVLLSNGAFILLAISRVASRRGKGPRSLHSLTSRCRILKMRRPESQASTE